MPSTPRLSSQPTVRQAAETVAQFMRLAKSGKVPPRSMLGRLCAFVTWLSHDQAYIRDINEKLVPLHPNAAQMLLLRSWMIQAARDVPIRTSILKARKLGASTFVQAFMYFCCKHYRNQRALTLAHVGEQTQEIFDITHRLGTNDPVGSPRQNRTMLFFSPSESRYSCHAAGGAGVAAGGTPNMLHRSELALWRPESQKIETDYTSGNAVPNTPTSMIIDESTARGRDLFFTRFKDAHKAEHPYEPVFLPWFLDSTLKAAGPDLWVQDDDEDRIVATGTLYGIVVSREQLAWRRAKIAETGSLRFKQEFPSTPEEAIEAQIGLVLPGLAACIIKELPFDYTAIDPATKLGGWDYGYNDPTAMVSAVYWDAALYVHDVHRARGELAEQSALNTMPGHRYYCDPSALGPRKEVAGHCGRLKIPATFVQAPRMSPARLEREKLKDEWEAVERMKQQGRLFILADCADQIIIEADNFMWNPKTGEPDKTRTTANDPVDWGHFDTLDALRYLVMGTLMADTPIAPPRRAEREPTRREMLRA